MSLQLPEPLGDRASQTFLRHFELCPRSAYLYAKYRRAGFQSKEMQRGRAFHEIVERATNLMMDTGEVSIPPEVVKVLVDEILAEQHVPWEEHDYVREMAFRWADETRIDPSRVLANETLFEIDVDGFKVRCRIDYALAVDDRTVRVEDYKTSRASESYEEVARKRPDGTWSAKNFQLVLYALALVYGVPVRVETCECAASPDPTYWCSVCGDKKVVETPDPFPLAARAEEFHLEFVYPGIESRDEKMVRVPLTLTRPELDAYMGSLHGLVARVRKSEAEGDWPAVASNAACGICPAKAECPLPAAMRDHVPVNDMAEASAVAEVLYVAKAQHRAFQTELRNFSKAHGPIPFGDGMVMDFRTSFDVNGKKRTEFIPQKVSADVRDDADRDARPELQEGPRGGGEEGGSDREEAGSRWGDEAPF